MPDIHRVGVISDTHLPRRAARIPDAALRYFEDADVELILHAGDLSTRAALDQLEAYAPVEAVQGNVEDAEIVRALPITRQLSVGGCLIGLVHILGDRATRRAQPDQCGQCSLRSQRGCHHTAAATLVVKEAGSPPQSCRRALYPTSAGIAYDARVSAARPWALPNRIFARDSNDGCDR